MNLTELRDSFATDRFTQRILAIASMLVCVLIYGCAPYKSENIKVTVTIEDNGVLYTGSSVQGIRCGRELRVANVFLQAATCDPHGEAVPIKLGNKGWVFMIFSGYQGSDPAALMQYNPEYYPYTIQANRSRGDPTQPWEVDLKRAPTFVRFTNRVDRKTAERLDAKQFEKHFGRGVKLLSIQCTPTKEWVTRGKIPKLLPWLDELGTLVIDDSVPGQPRSLISQISKSNFVWE